MGLLTDPNTGGGGASKAVTLVTSHHTKLSWLLYIAGVAFLLGEYLTIAITYEDCVVIFHVCCLPVLAHPIYNERTYFSENALLPGLVTGGFNQERAAVEFLSTLAEENKKYPGAAPLPWLEAQFRQMGLEVHQQQFRLVLEKVPSEGS